MKRIDKVAVLGAGVMGATIAGHLANAGISVLLLDLAADVSPCAPGPTAVAPPNRSRIAQAGRERLVKMKPPPLYLPEYLSYIEVGNFEDDMAQISKCDWVIEVVLEDFEVKRRLLTEKVIPNLKEGAILSSNTSGLSVNSMAQVLPPSLRRNFLVTHFFNPPRYMRLLEMVPCAETDASTVAGLAEFLTVRLGKGVVHAKDTPNFIANRIGTYAGANALKHMVEMGLTVEEVDAITGPAMGHPKTATFALWDLVGVDTVTRVCANSYELLTADEEREIFRIPDFVARMVESGKLGKKSDQGFYKRENVEGKSVKFYYDYRDDSYRPTVSPSFASVTATKPLDDPADRLRALLAGTDRGALYAWKILRDTLIYAARRIPEISDDIVNVDNALKWGYNWDLGPFEVLDVLGVARFVARAESDGCEVPAWLKEVAQCYKVVGGRNFYYSVSAKQYREVPTSREVLSLTLLKSAGAEVERNSGASLFDLGDGVFGLEFHTKMNAIGGEVLAMLGKGIARAEREGVALVIANQGAQFSVGANLMLIAMAIAEGEYDEIDLMVQQFQRSVMGIKYAKVPVVAAPHQIAFGGGCEVCLHSHAVTAQAETYMGLVEIGVGLIPAGGGTKEMALRAIRLASETGAEVSPFIFKNFQNIALGKVSACAAELFRMGYLRDGDSVSMSPDRRLHDAKLKALALATTYRPGRPATDLKAPGRSVAASIKVQLWNMLEGGFISEYDRDLAAGIAEVITGGNVPGGTLITEEYLLDLEREMFLKFCSQKKTLDRIQYMLKRGRSLRN